MIFEKNLIKKKKSQILSRLSSFLRNFLLAQVTYELLFQAYEPLI
jgi:hypothetical protein